VLPICPESKAAKPAGRPSPGSEPASVGLLAAVDALEVEIIVIPIMNLYRALICLGISK